MESLLEPTPDPAWVLVAEGFDTLREGIYESRFSISNGLLGVRAGRVVSRGERWVIPNRAYLAGLFDIPGSEDPIPTLVAAHSWHRIRAFLPGGPLVYHPAEAISHRMTLDQLGAPFYAGRAKQHDLRQDNDGEQGHRDGGAAGHQTGHHPLRPAQMSSIAFGAPAH
jgi:hypothetical protein